MRSYTILRNLTRPRTFEPFAIPPFGADIRARAAAAPPEAKVETGILSRREVQSLARDPEVRAIAPVMPIKLVRPFEVPAAAAAAATPWGLSAVGALESSRTGAGSKVAVLDTGIDSAHAAFTGVTIVEQDFSGSGNGDMQGHGTHCAGTILGREVAGTRLGVAPGVTELLAGKVLGNDGSGGSDMLFRGMRWAALEQNADVISMSLGFDFPGLVDQLVKDGWPADLATSAALEAYRANLRMFDEIMDMIRAQGAFTSGTIVVAAAGNESKREIDPNYEIAVSIPAAADGIVSVGALGQTPTGLRIADFSNTLPQVAAPGVAVLSAKAGGGTVAFSGTSMATPHVAGVAALWWEEVRASPLPARADVVLARMLAHARADLVAADVDIADRGVGIVRAPATLTS